MVRRDGKLAWRAVTTAAGIATGVVSKQALRAVWRRATGSAPPETPEHPDTALPAALVWALLLGAVGGVVKVCVTRRAAVSWRGVTGALPPGMKATAAG